MNCICEQCGHHWWARGSFDNSNKRPSRCPMCFTTAWDRARRKAGRPRNKPPEQPTLALEPVAPDRPPTMCPHNRPLGAACWQCQSVSLRKG
jgi:hypothetical protein